MSNLDVKFQPIDLKEITEEGEFEGYASKFGDVDQGGDVVLKGAFTGSLKRRETRSVKMLWQHSPSEPIGVWQEIKEDGEGLRVKGKILSTIAKGRETLDLMRAGVIDGLSIGFRTIKAIRDEKTGARQLKEVDLWEISLVTFPMLPSATVTSVKGDWDKRSVERVLRDAGMPNAMATKLVASGWDAANTRGQGDPDHGLSDLAQKLREMNQNMERRMKNEGLSSP